MVEQSAFARGGTTLHDLASEPLIMVHRSGQEVQGNLIDRTPRLCREPRQLGFEFAWNLQGVKSVNTCWGRPDVFAFVDAPDLANTVMAKIQGTEGVESTDTHIVIE